MPEKDLQANLDFVAKHRERLLKEHNEKFLLVYKGGLLSAYDTYATAANQGVIQLGMDAEFLVYYLTDEEPLNFVWDAIL